jgi:hypothetical protein
VTSAMSTHALQTGEPNISTESWIADEMERRLT